MKLRNKKTGEIIDGGDYLNVYDDLDHQGKSWHYNSLAELNADWEDYIPAEPLIKDEKIRKAIRAWAEANEVSQQIQFDRYTSGFSASDDGHNILSMISFDGFVFNCEDGEYYTIAELCGEEKE
jgi:hypothetical protein